MGKIEGKVALVTGAARGIGEAIARLFAAEGATVIIADVAAEAGAQLAAALGPRAHYVTLDVRDAAQWRETIAGAERDFGRLDILVHNAGIVAYKDIEALSEDEIRRIIDINLVGPILGTQAAIPSLERVGGTIVNISSVDGLTAHNAVSPYVASKWGLRGFTKAMALELGHRGIRVNSVHPGGVFTPLANIRGVSKEEFDRDMGWLPAQRTALTDEVARAVLFLAGPDGSYCMGAELSVDGGLTAGSYFPQFGGAPPALRIKTT